MKAIEILTNLTPYYNLLNEIYLKERDERRSFCKQLKSQYHFITLEIMSKSRENDKAGTNTEIKITFEIKRDIVILSTMYLADETKGAWIEQRIIEDKNLHNANWSKSPKIVGDYTEILTYLTIADSIASIGKDCSQGDNYFPGNYSEISITDKVIRLSQINHYNSRSIDHKQDYHLRELNCIIDLNNEMINNDKIETTRLGKLLINFSDRSSDNNKSCGRSILEKIEEEKSNFIKD